MKPHPRIRKTIKWGGAALTVLLVVVWIGSGWFHAEYHYSPRMLGVNKGMLLIVSYSPGVPMSDGWYGGQVFPAATWWWWFTPQRNQTGWYCYVPLWLLVTLSLVFTVLAFRFDAWSLRRTRRLLNLCPKCHYDMIGLAPTAVCPECGSGSNGGSPA